MPLRPLVPGVVEIWYTLTDQGICRKRADAYLSILCDRERLRHDAFHFARDRHLFRVSHALLRNALSQYRAVLPEEWRFETGQYGRPEISAPCCCGLRFSLSHTHGLAACAVAVGHDIGADVETIDRDLSIDPVAKLVLAESERQDLAEYRGREQHERFAEYWTLKEAYLKAVGAGLSLPLQSISFLTQPDGSLRIAFAGDRGDRPERWFFWQMRPSDRHCLAVAVAVGGSPVQVRAFEYVP